MSDNLSESPTNRRDNAAVDDSQTTNTGLAQICYILVCLHILLFNYLLIAHSNIYVEWLREDRRVENLTAVLFLLASIALFAAAWEERRIFPRCAYILGGMAMTFFGGEEISWGQRIIDFETPAFLADLNSQRQFNIHNIPEIERAIYGSLLKNMSYLLGIASIAVFFCHKKRLLGIPSPPILLTLALLIAMIYIDTGAWVFPDFLGSIIFWQRGLFLLLLLFGAFSKNAMLFTAAAASMSLTLAIAYVDLHNDILFSIEVFEYLISLIALFYALVALPDQGTARRMVAAAVAEITPTAALLSRRINTHPTKGLMFSAKIKRAYLTPWTAFCALIVAASVGLAFLAQFDVKADAAAFKETYLLTQTIEPMARSNFDVYLNGRDLHYFKQPCNYSDVQSTFFLAIFPADALDLDVDRRRLGFDNLDFYFDGARRSMILDGACAATVKIPTHYEIAGVSTGQFTVKGDGSTTNIWIAEFPVGDK